MEVSLLQHAKDKAPQRVTVDGLVEQLKNDSWPTGYQPLAVLGAVVEGGLQKKNVRWLTGLAVARLGHGSDKLKVISDQLKVISERVLDDPHTRLCWTDQSGGVYVVYEYELNDGYGKEQQIRYYGKVQHFGMDYYARLTGCEADRTLVGVIPPEERKRHAVSLAYDAMIKKRKSNASSEQTDTPDQPDTPDAF